MEIVLLLVCIAIWACHHLDLVGLHIQLKSHKKKKVYSEYDVIYMKKKVNGKITKTRCWVQKILPTVGKNTYIVKSFKDNEQYIVSEDEIA